MLSEERQTDWPRWAGHCLNISLVSNAKHVRRRLFLQQSLPSLIVDRSVQHTDTHTHTHTQRYLVI